jgi:hypothetical protein
VSERESVCVCSVCTGNPEMGPALGHHHFSHFQFASICVHTHRHRQTETETETERERERERERL